MKNNSQVPCLFISSDLSIYAVLNQLREEDLLASLLYTWLIPHLDGRSSGYEDGTFRPQQAVTRLEAAALIYKTLVLLGKAPGV